MKTRPDFTSRRENRPRHPVCTSGFWSLAIGLLLTAAAVADNPAPAGAWYTGINLTVLED